MFYQPPDLTVMIRREQVKDRERNLLAWLEPNKPFSRLIYRCGGLLIRLGGLLQRLSPAPERIQELPWPDQR